MERVSDNTSHSGTFRDILSLPPNETTTNEATRTVPVAETADLFHQWLHLIYRLKVDTTLDRPTDSSLTKVEAEEEEGEFQGNLPLSPANDYPVAGLQVKARFRQAITLLLLSDKYDSQLYDQLVRQRLFDILRAQKHPAKPSNFFVLACQKEWPDMAKEAISHFRVYTDKSHPGNVPPAFIHKIGVECYTAYVKAYFAGQKSRKAGGVDWEKVSQAFVLPKKP
jgi:hypothetical protein